VENKYDKNIALWRIEDRREALEICMFKGQNKGKTYYD
jgi:hypothetical protein